MGRRTSLLARLSKPLKPEREPWYVRHPLPPELERAFPAEGWYWIPREHHVAVYLAASFDLAAHQLRSMIERELTG